MKENHMQVGMDQWLYIYRIAGNQSRALTSFPSSCYLYEVLVGALLQ